jgi:hypothetical protein
MATLSSLFPVSQYLVGGASSGAFTQVLVYNTSVDSVQNGGQCCLWTVPAGTTWIRFEMWGGGSDGPGGCCCQQPNASGGAGAYARKTVTAVPGNTYTVCAGGSGCCSPNCCGTQGFTSYVCGGTGSGIVNACAAGGPPSCSQCQMYGGQSCVGNTNTCRSGSFSGADFGLPAIGGASHPSTCGYQSWQYVPSGPYIGAGARHSMDYCQSLSGCQAIGGFASFPGGGGGGAHSNGGGCCWGSHGAGGLVVISYR